MIDHCANLYYYKAPIPTLQASNSERIMVYQPLASSNFLTPPIPYNQTSQAYAQPFIVSTSPINSFGVKVNFAPSPNISSNKSLKRNTQAKLSSSHSSKEKNIKSKDTSNQRRKFTEEEDEKLKKLVEEMGSKKWEQIAKNMPGRTGRQCRDRYKNYLIPGFFNGQWSPEEDETLREKFYQYGSQWSKITQFFKNRSANSLKNRWNYFVSRHLDHQYPVIVQNIYPSNITNEINNEQENKNDVLLENMINCSSAINLVNDVTYDLYEIEPINDNDELSFKEDYFEFPFNNKI